MDLANKFVQLGMVPALAKAVADAIAEAGQEQAVAWADIDGAQAGVEAAVAAKTEVAALNGSSTAANIVTALQA